MGKMKKSGEIEKNRENDKKTGKINLPFFRNRKNAKKVGKWQKMSINDKERANRYRLPAYKVLTT